ncbi:unnamed protein product, partial [Polarella glacialis]
QCAHRFDHFEGAGCERRAAVSLDQAKSRSSNAAVTGARYHGDQDNRKLADDYEVEGDRVLGTGLCGNVVLARGRIDRRCYALKTISKLQVAPSKLRQLTAE